MKEIYRQAASVVLLRPSSEDQYQILLLHKPRKGDAWQLPQGGVEMGETVEEAALRELREETGIEDATLLGHSAEVYAYDFPPSFRRFRPDNVKGQQIRYIFARTKPDVNVQVDGKEIDAYVWVDQAQIGMYIKRKAYLRVVEKMVEEAIKELRMKN